MQANKNLARFKPDHALKPVAGAGTGDLNAFNLPACRSAVVVVSRFGEHLEDLGDVYKSCCLRRRTVPMHVAKSPHVGSGKSFLADLASVIATGERCPVIGKVTNREEMEKRLATAAMEGMSIVSLDNVNDVLSSELLAQLVERPTVLCRVLGVNKQIKVQNNFTVFANGNNLVTADDLVRRTIQCSLDANMEHPEQRQFKRNPVKTVLGNRGAYVVAILTMLRAYICAGMPDRPKTYMSFECYSDLIRGSLIWLGRADPLDTVFDLANADPVRENRLAVFSALRHYMLKNKYPSGYTTAEIINEARQDPKLQLPLLKIASDDGERLNPSKLGRWLTRSENQLANDLKLTRDTSFSSPRYRVVSVKSGPGFFS
jgi:putative DNA primase/helicase